MRKAKKERGRPLPAAEFVAKLEEDLNVVTASEQFERRRRDLIAQHRIAALPIVEELKVSGFVVESLDDLRRSGIDYTAAVPLLLKWLPVVKDPGLKESIVRALSVPYAKPAAAAPLIREFEALRGRGDSGLAWAIGNALEVVADDSVFDQICNLVHDRNLGTARQMMVVALGNMKNPRAVDLAIELLTDEDLTGHAVLAIRKLKARVAIPHVERLLQHPTAWIRQEAKKAVASLR